MFFYLLWIVENTDALIDKIASFFFFHFIEKVTLGIRVDHASDLSLRKPAFLQIVSGNILCYLTLKFELFLSLSFMNLEAFSLLLFIAILFFIVFSNPVFI